MHWIVAGIKGIMLVSGALTCTMVYAAIAPQAALRSTFGATLDGPVAEIVVRNWGALIALVGGMLIYGAFHPAARALALVVAGLSKVWFLTLLVVFGRSFLGGQAGVALVSDTIQVALFVVYLVLARRGTEIPQSPRPVAAS
jgi:hypothetical protein